MGEHSSGTRCGIELATLGGDTRVRTWSPLQGAFVGFLGSHAESFSIADHLTVHNKNGNKGPVYRPTVHFAYSPCPDTLDCFEKLSANNYAGVEKMTLLKAEEITEGIDELGVFLGGTRKVGSHFGYWYGSQLSTDAARVRVEGTQATTLQVTASATAGVLWVLRNPSAGVVEPDDLDHDAILDVISPYIAPVVGEYTTWTPLQGQASTQ